MFDSAMDDRKKSFQVKQDLLMLECNIACKNINAAVQRSSSLVTSLLSETDLVPFSNKWPYIMSGLDAFIHCVTEFNHALDKQLSEFPNVEVVFPTEFQRQRISFDVSDGKEVASSISATSCAAKTQSLGVKNSCQNSTVMMQSPDVQNACSYSTARMQSLGVQDVCLNSTISNQSLDAQSSNTTVSMQSSDVQDASSYSNVSMQLPGVQNGCLDSTVIMQSSSIECISSQLPPVKQPVISIGSVLSMVYLHGDNPESFWLRFADNDKINKAKKKMLAKISTSAVEALDVCPSVGDHVCTVINKSNLVRGEVRIVKNSKVNGVKFVLLDVDNGSTVIVDSKNLWKQEPELAVVPAQAVHCRLKGRHGIVPPHAFTDMCTGRHLEVNFCSLLKGEYPFYAVEMISCDPESKCRINVNKWVMKFFGSATTIIGSSRAVVGSKEKVMPDNHMKLQKAEYVPSKSNGSMMAADVSAKSLENKNICASKASVSNGIVYSPPVSSVEGCSSTNVNTLLPDACDSVLYPVSNAELSIEPSQCHVGEVAHCISPSEFFLHIGRNKIKALNLSDKMMLHYQNNTNLLTLKNKRDTMQRVGVYCVCMFVNRFYRAKVLNWMPDDQERVLVQFMDYGYTRCVHFTNLQTLHHEFAELPELVNKCHLSNILPADSHGKVASEWSCEAVKYFNELLQYGVQYAVYIASKRINDPPDSLAVILVDERDGQSKIINDTLLSYGCAVSAVMDVTPEDVEIKNKLLSVEPYLDSNADFENFDPMTEDHNSNTNTYDHDVEDARFVVSGWKSTDEEQVCPLFQRYGRCRRPPGTCMKKHIALDPNGIVTDKELVYYRAFEDLILPHSSTFRVVLTAAESLSVLYFVLAKEMTDNSKNAEGEAEDEETLNSLTTYMNSANNVRKMKRLLVPPALGQLVIAKHRDYLWHRGSIVDWEDDGDRGEKVVVLFVDSGEKLSIPEENLRCMEPKYLHLPLQAMEFRLADLQLDSLDESEMELYLKLLQGMVGVEFSATVVSWSPALELTLESDDGDLVRLLEDQVLAFTLNNVSSHEDT